MSDNYVPGDCYVICEFSGWKCRMSETVKLWNGRRVLRRFAGEEVNRHPQEFVRGRVDHQRVPDGRPEPADTFHDIGDVTRDSL